MKRLYIIIIALAAIAAAASAQSARWGVLVGGAYSNLHFNQDIIAVSGTGGVTAGVKGEFNIAGIGFGLEGGILYDLRGANVDLSGHEVWTSQGYGKEHLYLHTVNIPIHLRYMYQRLNGLEHKVAPFVFAGPQFCINVGNNLKEVFETPGLTFSVQFGTGARLYDHWQVAFIYDWGISYATRTKLLDDYSAKNRAWKLQLTYFFGE